MHDGDARPTERVGPIPDAPPDRLTAWIVLDLLATARRWRARDPFVTGRVDALGTAMVECLNDRKPIPRWLRRTVVGALMDHLWEYPKPADADGAREWSAARDGLVSLWREEPAGGSELR